jgi:hypothetical protein
LLSTSLYVAIRYIDLSPKLAIGRENCGKRKYVCLFIALAYPGFQLFEAGI